MHDYYFTAFVKRILYTTNYLGKCLESLLVYIYMSTSQVLSSIYTTNN